MNTAVNVVGLRKTYGEFVAVDGVSFEVYESEIFGMVGPNGAGKTTTVECLEGLRTADQGNIRVLGVDPRVDGGYLRTHTGMQLQESNLQERLKVWEALDLYASFYPHTVNWEQLLVQLGLEEKRNTIFRELSGGQKQRLFIALALLHDPQLIFLDELTTGLDPRARLAIWDLVRDVRNRGKTILMTTHFMEEAERLCDRIAIMDQGRIVALDTPSNLIRNLGIGEQVSFCVEEELPQDFFRNISEDTQIDIRDRQVSIISNQNHQDPLVVQVVDLLSKNGIAFYDLRIEQPDLEDVFLNLTGSTMDEGGVN
jgi:ABC-2 type transport system ATP-binding protein